MSGELTTKLQELSEAIQSVAAVDCPLLIGELEKMKAVAWGKMLNGHGSAHSPDVAKEDLLTIAQVSKRLNVKASFAYELVRGGKLHSVRLGKYVRVTEQALAEYQATLTKN